MQILLLSAGGGGGNILRSVKASFRRDLAVTQKADSRYAERLRRAVTTRFLDTNEFALSDLPKEEQVLIGTHTTGRLGARHDPEVALQALNESRSEVEALFSRYSIIILIGTGGKGTGSGTMFPLAQIARQQKKLVIPIFVRPSFERHEVDKRHYDHAVNAIEQFDSAGIRLIEILNDRGYMEHDPQPQPIVWERMNLPIARGLRGLIYVLWDLSQVDPSDLSMLFAGTGRLRIGFAEINPPEGGEPNDELVAHAAARCCDNPYYAFHKPAGTSLICIQGDWSNVVDAKLKGRLAAAMAADSQSPYSPLYARAVGTPKPWGVTALFAEYTGVHRPLEVDWSLERGVRTNGGSHRTVSEPVATEPYLACGRGRAISCGRGGAIPCGGRGALPARRRRVASKVFLRDVLGVCSRRQSFRSRGNGAGWQRRRFRPADRRSRAETTPPYDVVSHRIRPALTRLARTGAGGANRGTEVPDHAVRLGRQTVHLRGLSFEQLQTIGSTTMVADWIRPDLELLITVGRFWGAQAVTRFRFVQAPERYEPSRMETLLQRLRG